MFVFTKLLTIAFPINYNLILNFLDHFKDNEIGEVTDKAEENKYITETVESCCPSCCLTHF